MRRSATHSAGTVFLDHLQCSSSIQLVESNAQLGRSNAMDAIHDVFSCIFGTKCLAYTYRAGAHTKLREAPAAQISLRRR